MISRILLFLLELPIRAYRYLISPLLAVSCRYSPTCSDYALQALKLHGPMRGSWLALARLARCHPWGGHGHDPVPGTTGTPGQGHDDNQSCTHGGPTGHKA